MTVLRVILIVMVGALAFAGVVDSGPGSDRLAAPASSAEAASNR